MIILNDDQYIDQQKNIYIHHQVLINKDNFSLQLQYGSFSIYWYCFYLTSLIFIQIFFTCKLINKIILSRSEEFKNQISPLSLGFTILNIWYYVLTTFVLKKTGFVLIIPFLFILVIYTITSRLLGIIWLSQQSMQNLEFNQMIRARVGFTMKLILGLVFYLIIFRINRQPIILVFQSFIITPQIVHNFIRKKKVIFIPEYYCGLFLTTQFFYPIYLLACPYNLVYYRQSFTYLIIFILSYLIQIMVLLLQIRIGPRFFLPVRFQHRPFSYFSKVELQKYNNEDQCNICLAGLNINQSDNIEMQKQLFSGQVMVTPCNHQYHEQCLNNWLQIKLECPTCRCVLPPNEK